MKSSLDHWYDLFGRSLTRRDVLRVGRNAAACIALSGLPGTAGASRRLADNPFTLGVASGDPEDDEVVLWTRLAASAVGGAARPSVRWEIAEDQGFKRVVKRGHAPAPPELGYSVHAEVGGLQPARDYWYRFDIGGEASPVGRTRTAPDDKAMPDRLRFAFASCQNYEHGYFTAHRHMAAETPDLVIFLGDYIYEKRFSPALTVREAEAGEVFTLDQYRARYAHYRGDADLQASHAAAPWVVTTDDHEVANNYAADLPEIPVPRDQFLLRRAAGYQAYYEFMPLRRSSMPKGPDLPLFRRLPFGRLFDLHVLDTRQYRSDQTCGDGRKARCAESNDPARTMMGAPQEKWLADGLRASETRWNVIANQVQLAQVVTRLPGTTEDLFAMDNWNGYPAARQRMLDLLASVRQKNPVVVTGDIHTHWVAELKQNFNDPASPIIGTEFIGTSITSGGDGNDTPSTVQDLNPHIKFFASRRGYVLVTVTPDTCTADYRVVPLVSKPGGPVETRATFAVRNGRPGVERT